MGDMDKKTERERERQENTDMQHTENSTDAQHGSMDQCGTTVSEILMTWIEFIPPIKHFERFQLYCAGHKCLRQLANCFHQYFRLQTSDRNDLGTVEELRLSALRRCQDCRISSDIR